MRREAGSWPPVTYWMRVTVVILAVLALARIVLAIGDVLVLVLVSLILALGFQPAVEWLERRGLRRGWAIALGLLAGAMVIGVFLWLVLPGVIQQIGELVRDGPRLLDRAQQRFPFLADLNSRFQLEQKLRDASAELPGTVLGLVGSFASLVFGSLTVLILTIYFTVNMPKIRAGVAAMLRPEHREDFEEILGESTQRVGGYVLGNIAVSTIAGFASFLALLIIGVPFAAALAFLVALLDLIPTVGALIAAVLATAVAAFSGLGLGATIATAGFFLVYQQVENYLVQPRVMRKAIDMSAPVVILAVLIGGTLLGVVGALLALPVAAVIKVAFRELYLEDRLAEVQAAERGGT